MQGLFNMKPRGSSLLSVPSFKTKWRPEKMEVSQRLQGENWWSHDLQKIPKVSPGSRGKLGDHEDGSLHMGVAIGCIHHELRVGQRSKLGGHALQHLHGQSVTSGQGRRWPSYAGPHVTMLGVVLPCFSQEKRRFKMVDGGSASHGSGIPLFHPECRFGHPESAPQSKPRPELCNDSWPVGHPKRTSRGRAQNLPGSAYRSHLEDWGVNICRKSFFKMSLCHVLTIQNIQICGWGL